MIPETQEGFDVWRREFITTTIAAAGLTLYGGTELPQSTRAGRQRVGSGDLAAVKEMSAHFSRVDQRWGGGHGRSAVVQYFNSEVSPYLRSSYTDDRVRSEMFSAAGELAYLSGWMAFDDSEHVTARHHLEVALRLAIEADDRPLAGHILRAMAHQAIDLGHYRQALELAAASVDRRVMTLACPRERALLQVVYARALGTMGERRAAAAALPAAETYLASAAPGDDEPARISFFGEASLADQTARTLQHSGDLSGAVREFRHSATKRAATTFTRTHVLTMSDLGTALADAGSIDEACGMWSQALDAMDGIKSGRVRQTVTRMRTRLSSFGTDLPTTARDLDSRAAAYLAAQP